MWLVWRPGSPDPSRFSTAIHYDDPKRDRDTSRSLEAFPIKPEHRGMTLSELLTIADYHLPAKYRASIEGDSTRAIQVAS